MVPVRMIAAAVTAVVLVTSPRSACTSCKTRTLCPWTTYESSPWLTKCLYLKHSDGIALFVIFLQDQLKTEVMQHGPVEVDFPLFMDFQVRDGNMFAPVYFAGYNMRFIFYFG